VRTRDLVVAIDVSDSMLCPDLRPTRLQRSLEVLAQSLPALEGNRLGVVVFAGEAYPLVPLTTDLSAVATFLDGVEPGMVGLPGSNIGGAVAAALRLLPTEGEGRVVVLITDGENLQGDVAAAARALREAGVGVLGVVAGTERGGPIPMPSADGSVRYKRSAEGQPVVTRAHPETLRQLVGDADVVVLELGDREVVRRLIAAVEELRTRELEATRTVQRVERFPFFLAAAAARKIGKRSTRCTVRVASSSRVRSSSTAWIRPRITSRSPSESTLPRASPTSWRRVSGWARVTTGWPSASRL
jgi:Ca-activated chloride channel family protein